MSVINSIPLIAAAGGDYQISRSVRLRSSATAYLNRTPASASNRQRFTWSGWVKRGALSNGVVFSADSSGGGTATESNNFNISFTSDTLTVGWSGGNWRVTSQVFRDPSAWYHLVVAFDTTQATAANRVAVYVNGSAVTAFSTNTAPTLNVQTAINNTVTHRLGNYSAPTNILFDGYLTEVNFIDGQALTASSFGETDGATGVWKPKRYAGTYGTNGFYLPFSNNTTAENRVFNSQLIGSTYWGVSSVTVSANSIVAPDGSTTASTLTAAGSDSVTYQGITGLTNGATYTFSVWLKSTTATAITLFVDLNGSATAGYATSDISVTTSWKRFSVTFTAAGTTSTVVIGGGGTFSTGEVLHAWGAQVNSGTEAGAYIKTTTTAITGAVALGQDYSLGAESYNTWTCNNISLTAGVTYDSMIDTPTPYADGGNGRGNYCVFNPLVGTHSNTYSNGNLQVATSTANAAFSHQRATFGVASGKWYWEITCQATSSAYYIIGITADTVNPDSQYIGQGNSYSYRNDTGQKGNNGTFSSYGATFTTGDIIGVEFDADAGTLVFYKNGTSQGTAFTGISGTYFPAVADLDNNTSRNSTFIANFGQRPFAYTPPTGFKALNTQNLPDATIKKGNAYFDATTYTGAGTAQAVTNAAGFQPDLVWVKGRSSAWNHYLTDSSRGTSSLTSNSTAAENAGGVLSSINSNGFTTNNWYEAGGNNGGTGAGGSLVAWQWKESASAGFDIVTYTGTGVARTVAHSLGVAPSMIIVKNRSGVDNWWVYSSKLPITQYLQLNLTAAANTSTTLWNSTSPTSSVFSLGVNNANTNAATYVAYLFAEVAGFSKFGSYTGNGSADGPFVYCGFRPRFVLMKRTDSVGSFWMLDSARDTYNLATKLQRANEPLAEETSYANIDMLSNGFKIRVSSAESNASGGTYIFAAFAENPFKNSLAR